MCGWGFFFGNENRHIKLQSIESKWVARLHVELWPSETSTYSSEKILKSYNKVTAVKELNSNS